jgi:hypothetical protein
MVPRFQQVDLSMHYQPASLLFLVTCSEDECFGPKEKNKGRLRSYMMLEMVGGGWK